MRSKEIRWMREVLYSIGVFSFQVIRPKLTVRTVIIHSACTVGMSVGLCYSL
jgi:hypothetical protein